MQKKEASVIKDIKDNAKEQVEKMKDFAKDFESNMNEQHEFKKYSIKVKRMNSQMIKLNRSLFGVFDEVKMTLTYRIKDEYQENELIEVLGKVYQIVSISKKTVQFPIMVDNEEQGVECKIASLKHVDAVQNN